MSTKFEQHEFDALISKYDDRIRVDTARALAYDLGVEFDPADFDI